jgi:NhaP-type Na+/H+ or K+/H+ antiporter
VSSALLPVVTLILILGVGSRLIADRLRIPSVLFLIGSGVAIGPEGLGVVSREVFGNGLTAMVGVAVAIILFEGSFRLRLERFREAPRDILRLVTVGAVVMWLGTALVVRFVLSLGGEPVEWSVALLVGALLIATGPTVVTPILNVVTVRDHVAAAMESEGIINDVTAAVLAVVVFEVLILETAGLVPFVEQLLLRIGVGIVAGLLVAGLVWALLKQVDISPGDAPLHSRLIALGGILGTFATAELVAGESGVAAAATLGLVLGNVELPHEEDIEGFMEDLTTIVLGFVFVAIAALISFEDITALGVAGVALVIAVTLFVRPLLVFLSVRNDRFTTGERVFMSTVAPRGIIPASVATLFAIELQAEGAVAEAQVLAGTVFLIIFATVVFQGGFARQIAERLDVVPMRTIIAGGGEVGSALAERLERDGENVVIVEIDDETVQDLREDGHRVVQGDAGQADDLRSAGIENAGIVVATTRDDDVNLLVCQLVQTEFGIDTVAARVNDAENLESFESIGVRAIDFGSAMAQSLENVLERPAIASWMNDLGRSGDVREIEVTAADLVGETPEELYDELPDGCIIGVISEEGGETHVPSRDHCLQRGDHITFIGQRDAVERAVKRFHPHE